MKFVFECNNEIEIVELRDYLLKMYPVESNKNILGQLVSDVLTVRTSNLLAENKVYRFRDLIECTEGQLLKLPGMGRKGFNEIIDVIKEKGLKLKG